MRGIGCCHQSTKKSGPATALTWMAFEGTSL